jgi:aerobic carbon-monoxide dehydrogenase small subunit
MSAVSFTVNGKTVQAHVEPRLHLADFLREKLHLTGTHLGCEHGVCGACTLLLDGEPARSCITFAAVCEGVDVRSIEGLEDDAVTVALREAFKAEHALQCGFCTPGMLVTARDIVRRLPDADDDRVRIELAGNLCRCTGYNGIVRAVRRVLDARLNIAVSDRVALPAIRIPRLAEPAALSATTATAMVSRPGSSALTQKLRLAVPYETLWRALQDPALVASCVPGARLTSVENNHIVGEMVVALGPIQGRFVGTADISYDVQAHSGIVHGEGQDQISNTRLSAQAEFFCEAEDDLHSSLTLNIAYSLRGALAQFARGPVVQAFADEIAGIVGRNLQARVSGEAAMENTKPLSAAKLFARVIWTRLKRLLFGKVDAK